MALTPIDAAMGVAVDQAVNEAATVRFARITSVDLVNLTVNVDFGETPVINVPLMGGVTPKVGDMGWLLYQGSMLVCIGPTTADGGGGTPPPSTGSGVPIGSVEAFAGSTLPTDWLWCDGSTYSTTTYAALFNIIGYTYGGSADTFNVPDLRDRSVVGAGPSTALGASGGKTSINSVVAHSHSMSGSIYVSAADGLSVSATALNEQNGQNTGQNHGHGVNPSTLAHVHSASSANHSHTVSGNTGLGGQHAHGGAVTGGTTNTNTSGGGSLARVSSLNTGSVSTETSHSHGLTGNTDYQNVSVTVGAANSWGSNPSTFVNGSHWHSVSGTTNAHAHGASHNLSAASTGDASVDIRNPYLGLNYMIKAK